MEVSQWPKEVLQAIRYDFLFIVRNHIASSPMKKLTSEIMAVAMDLCAIWNTATAMGLYATILIQ
jgi:hypothetical protein